MPPVTHQPGAQRRRPVPAVAAAGCARRDLVVNLPVATATRRSSRPSRSAIASPSSRCSRCQAARASPTGWRRRVCSRACAAATEVIVERPAYEPLLRIRGELRHERAAVRSAIRGRLRDRSRIAVKRSMTPRRGWRSSPTCTTRQARGVDIGDAARDGRDARARVGAYLLVDEVYLECLFGRNDRRPPLHAGPNVIADQQPDEGVRPRRPARRLAAGSARIHAACVAHAGSAGEQRRRAGRAAGVGGVQAPAGDSQRMRTRRSTQTSQRVRDFFVREHASARVRSAEAATSCFHSCRRESTAIGSRRICSSEYSTLVVPGRFFEAPRHFRISFGCRPAQLERGLENISRALDDLISTT